MVTFLVKDYDEAIDYFTKNLGFLLIKNEELNAQKRWVVVGNDDGFRLLLAKANGASKEMIGDQFGGRVGFFLETDDFDNAYKNFTEKGVNFLENVRCEPYGKVVQFADLYGNKWDLISAQEDI